MMPPHASLRHQLMARADGMEARLMQGALRDGYGGVTTAMNRMFLHLHGRPVGLSELARALAVSRQAVHQLANEAAAMGLVEFVPSETDGRVRLLRFTQKGWAMSERAMRELERIEAEVAARIGERDLRELKRILGRAWTAEEDRDRGG